MRQKDRKLVLEDGTSYEGYGFGAEKERVLELVFNTAMTGYQEIVSDLSYTDQGVVMTYPLIGNYGMNDEDYESRAPGLAGLIAHDYNDFPSNFRCTKTLGEVLEENGIPGIFGVDTRQITKHIRDCGTMRACITDIGTEDEEAVCRIGHTPVPHDQVRRASCRKKWYARYPDPKYNVVAIDCGMKMNIVRSLGKCGCNVTIVPYDTDPEDIMFMKPDGIFISNGPGDPEDAAPVIETIRALRGKYPLFGICLGHQLISLAYGAKTYKLKFGHRGGNHPVMEMCTGKIEITSQNHSYAVEETSTAGTGLVVTHKNLLDGSVEGISCAEDRVFGVQYHPESAPGPQDSGHLFRRFTAMMEKR